MKTNSILRPGAFVTLLLEIICLAAAWVATGYGEADNLAYVPYVFTALTLAFISFFTFLFALIFVILKGRIREQLFMLNLWLVAFLLPVLAYFALFH